MRVLLLGLLILLVAACGTEGPAIDAQPTGLQSPGPLVPEPPAPEPPAPTPGISLYLDYIGAATASLEERIYAADVVVRASFVSASGSRLTFRAVEYLKGSGAKEFTIQSEEPDRDTQWDNVESVLFLRQGGAAGQRSASGANFEFTDTTSWAYYTNNRRGQGTYAGSLPDGHEVTSRNPVWLPARSTAARSSSAGGTDPVYLTGEGSVSLDTLRSKVAWVEGGAGVEGYDQCIRRSLADIRTRRDYEAYHQEPYDLEPSYREIPSGAPRGEVVHFYGPAAKLANSPVYYNYWLSGEDASLFYSEVVDPDEDSTNGWRERVAAARPLPSGTYTFVDHVQHKVYFACDFTPSTQLRWYVTLTAPAGTLAEAFFDPVADGGATTATTTVGTIRYESNTVKATLTPTVTNHILDFIALDGSVALSLDVADATTTDGVLGWTVTPAPWSAGDKLMLRIRSPRPSSP